MIGIDPSFCEVSSIVQTAKHKLAGAVGAIFLFTSILASETVAAPSPQSEALAACLYEHADRTDRDVLVQWAFVTIAKTRAAKAVETIPETKIRKTEAAAQRSLTNLVMKHCAEPALRLAFKSPKDGLQDTLVSLAKRLVVAELDRRKSPLLALTLSDLIQR